MKSKLVAIISATLLISACEQKVSDQCWSSETKQKAGEVAKKAMRELMVKEARDTWPAGKDFTASDENKISEMVSVSLSDFHQISKDKDAGSYRCGANAKASLTISQEENIESKIQVIEFNVNPAENGTVVSMNANDGILNLKNSLTDAINVKHQ